MESLSSGTAPGLIVVFLSLRVRYNGQTFGLHDVTETYIDSGKMELKQHVHPRFCLLRVSHVAPFGYMLLELS